MNPAPLFLTEERQRKAEEFFTVDRVFNVNMFRQRTVPCTSIFSSFLYSSSRYYS